MANAYNPNPANVSGVNNTNKTNAASTYNRNTTSMPNTSYAASMQDAPIAGQVVNQVNKGNNHTGGMYKNPLVGAAGASVTLGGSNRTIIDPECLGEYISELRTLSETVTNAAFKPTAAGRCGGKTINEIETMGILYGEMREAISVLIEKTISYMEARKTSVETKETTLAAATVAGSGTKATMQTK